MAEDIVYDKAINSESAIDRVSRGDDCQRYDESDGGVVDQWESHKYVRGAEPSIEQPQEPDCEIRGGHAERRRHDGSGGGPEGTGDAGRHWDDRGEARTQDDRRGETQGGEIDGEEVRTLLLAETIICRPQSQIDDREEEARTA